MQNVEKWLELAQKFYQKIKEMMFLDKRQVDLHVYKFLFLFKEPVNLPFCNLDGRYKCEKKI